MKPGIILPVIAIAALLLCANKDAAAGERGEAHVVIDNFTYNPGTITVPAGTNVEWVNNDEIPHTVAATNNTFHSKQLDAKDKFSFTFTQPGTYDYFCSLHPRMAGKVVVTP